MNAEEQITSFNGHLRPLICYHMQTWQLFAIIFNSVSHWLLRLFMIIMKTSLCWKLHGLLLNTLVVSCLTANLMSCHWSVIPDIVSWCPQYQVPISPALHHCIPHPQTMSQHSHLLVPVQLLATALHSCYFPSTCILWKYVKLLYKNVSIQMKAVKQCPGNIVLPCLLLLIVLSKVVFTVESVFAILKCDQSKESSSVLSLLSWRTVSVYAAQWGGHWGLRWCGFCDFFRGIAVMGTPQCPPPQLSVQWGFNFGVCRCSP